MAAGLQPSDQTGAHVRPLVAQDREHHGVPERPVGPDLMTAQHALPDRAELGDGGLRAGVQVVGLDLDPTEPAVVEGSAPAAAVCIPGSPRCSRLRGSRPSSPGGCARRAGTRHRDWRSRRSSPPGRLAVNQQSHRVRGNPSVIGGGRLQPPRHVRDARPAGRPVRHRIRRRRPADRPAPRTVRRRRSPRPDRVGRRTRSAVADPEYHGHDGRSFGDSRCSMRPSLFGAPAGSEDTI